MISIILAGREIGCMPAEHKKGMILRFSDGLTVVFNTRGDLAGADEVTGEIPHSHLGMGTNCVIGPSRRGQWATTTLALA